MTTDFLITQFVNLFVMEYSGKLEKCHTHTHTHTHMELEL